MYKEHPTIPGDWTPIPSVTRQIQPSNNLDVYFNRTQFPLLPAAARTGIRTQSTTLPMLACDPRTPRQEHGYVYSNCMCTTTKEGLFLLHPVTLDMFRPQPAVVQEVQRLRTEAQLQLVVPDFANPGLHCVSHNVASFDSHLEDITAPCNPFWQAHTVHMCEMHSMRALPSAARDAGFEVVASTSAVLGSALLVSQAAPGHAVPGSGLVQVADGHWALLSCLLFYQNSRLAVLGVYRSPSCPNSSFAALADTIVATCQRYQAAHILLMGDFNIDMLNDGSPLVSMLAAAVLQPLHLCTVTRSEPTTIRGTAIDHIHTDWPATATKSGTLNAYISDHYPVYATLAASAL